MKLETFALERYQSIWENRVAWNLAESGVHPLRVTDLVNTPELQVEMLEQELGYPQTNGTFELRSLIASLSLQGIWDLLQAPECRPRWCKRCTRTNV